MSNRKLAHAVHLALFASGAGLMGVAQAQAPVIEEVVVTGTRIPNANLVASSPVTQIDSEDFRFAGATRVEDLLNTYPQMAPAFDAFTVNPTTGYATADLRGLGSNRTLVLVNGNRLPPGGIRSQARDLNQIPSALIQRVEILTGGASVVYGSDAMAGVVNFILDNEFEGVSVDVGWQGYQHNNSSGYMRGLMDQAGFDYPTGSGFDGDTYHIDLALGSSFADGRGHAMAYVTYRDNEEMRQGTRDYSACALNDAGTACGGSSTSDHPNFFLVHPDLVGFAHQNQDGSWAPGIGELYNYAPINHYQRPEERWTFGGSLRYEFSPHFQPYVETMFTNTSTSVQIAESGTFFVNFLEFDCGDALIGSMCGDLGLDPADEVGLYVGKRNTEGGPRIAHLESDSFRIVVGSEGQITGNWDYDMSFLYSRNTSNETNENDFLTERLAPAMLNCADPALVGTPACYNVWVPGGVTEEAAAQLGGIGARQGTTELWGVTGFVTGITDFRVPMANDPVSVVLGLEYRKESYDRRSDTNMAEGNFTGLGGPRPSVSGNYSVREFFVEVGIPVIQDQGALQNLGVELGYRRSHYSTSGGVNTFKIGATADIFEHYRIRGGFNRAIRAPNVDELFAQQQIALWSGDDPCAGATPEFTEAQCANTGVLPGQYGNIQASPASQYNQFLGGNPDLEPEEADTWTLGVVATPLDGLTLSVDYFDIKIEDRIGGIGAETVLRFCGLTGDPFLCDKVRRGASGDLWLGSDPDSSGLVENLDSNFGDFRARGIDFQASYNWDWLGGMWTANFNGTWVLEDEVAPLPGVNPDATYDCRGVLNTSCQTPEWKHTARLIYSRDNITGTLRWRYIGELDYETTAGDPATTDQLLVDNGGKLDAWNYFDVTAAYAFNENITLSAGVNNIFDKKPPLVGATLSLNANSLGGYDQLGRFVHTRLSVHF